MIAKLKFIPIAFMMSFGLSACGAGMLQTKDFEQPYNFAIDEESKIADTEENFEILQTVQKYRDAIVNKDINTLKGMISKD